jgi:hypothetical protein
MEVAVAVEVNIEVEVAVAVENCSDFGAPEGAIQGFRHRGHIPHYAGRLPQEAPSQASTEINAHANTHTKLQTLVCPLMSHR